LLIVGCSIALVVTLRQTLEAIPYFRFMLSAAVTLGLFGAGQYTLHRWKLSGTSRGMLVIALLLSPLTLLLLADPFTQGTSGVLDIAVKLGALVAFVGVVRTGGRDLIGTEHLPGPIDRRWLLSLAVVGAAATQLLPAAATPWLPLLCFVVATAATIGGLSWYHPARRHEPVSEKSGTALLMFTGLAVFALLASWGLYLVRTPDEVASRLHALALPLALAAIPVVEAGVLVLRRVTSSVGLRTTGTAVALAGALGMTIALALAWPNPAGLTLVAATTGAFLTFVAVRERLPWMQCGAIPLLAFAAVLGFHGIVGSWRIPADTLASEWLRTQLDSSETGAVLTGFALLLALTAELLARRPSRQTRAYALGAVVVGAFGLLVVSTHGVARPVVAAFAHVAIAVGLLASNIRWKQRAVAHGGLWVALAGTMWALWWLVPRQPALWGFVVAVEAVFLAVGSVLLRGTHGPATALLRRAARDVSFAECILAIVLGVTSFTLRSEWHSGTLFALMLAAFALARLTGFPPLTWAGSVAALLGLAHLGLYTCDLKPETLTIEAALLAHSFLATLAAVACRRQARVFGDPLRWSARLSSVLAVPLLFFPPLGLAYVSALLAVWLGVLWLAFSFLWRERGAFSAFQGAITLAALLIAFGWIEQQSWWATTSLNLRDPRALHAFGFALGGLAIAWVIARRAFRPLARARELWCDDPLSLDRIALAAAVIAFLFLHVVAIVPGVRAELTPLGYPAPILAPPELAHAFDVEAMYLFLLLGLAVCQSWRLTTLERDTDAHVLGVVFLYLSLAVVWAGSHEIHTAAASALRWGFALAFVVGSGVIALRVPIRRLIDASGFPMQPSPWLRGWLLAIFAIAAGVVVLLSANVADIGLHRWKPSGPAETSIFALMGTIASNLVPLALVVFGLGLTAGRERSAGYALSGGLVFVATLTAGYALALVTAGKPLDGPASTLLCLIAAASAAVWAIAWLAVEWRVPGGVPLTVQVCLGFAALALISLLPATQILAAPAEQLPVAFAPLGQFGWGVLALVGCAGFWHTRRVWPEATTLVFAFMGLIMGVLVAAALRDFDTSGSWLSFHALALTWTAVGFAFFAYLKRGELVKWLLTALTSLLVICALRAGWTDPWKPWLPAGLSLTVALFLGAIALQTRLVGYALASGLAVNLTATFVWIAWGPDTLTGFLLANASGLATVSAVWTLVRIRQAVSETWLAVVDFAPAGALALLALGLLRTLTGEASNPWSLAWGATATVAIASAVGLWDRAAKLSRPVLYATGVLAVLLGAATADRPLPVWDTALAPLALAAFALAVAVLAVGVTRRAKPLWRIPDSGEWRQWLPRAQAYVAVAAAMLGVRIGLLMPSIWERLASPLAAVILAPCFALLARIAIRAERPAMRMLAVAFLALAPAALAWAAPDPSESWAWLHRNAWLFVALTFAAIIGSEAAARAGDNWREAVRTVAGWVAAGAFVVLCVNLLQQVPAFDPKMRRTPLTREESLAMLLAIAGLFALALRFALKADRDPFELRPNRRTAYVYAAEVLLVLFFTQVRYNVPELFLKPELVKLWTFAVMALAYVGIGLAELFERKKIEVLALPLRHTGVLLPLVPLIAFWAKPPAFVNEFAGDRAPGLVPFLNYLRNLPQHFDTYAWLWFLAGGVYGLVALSRKSFGWGLLAALATNAAMWSLLAHHEVPFAVHPQAWVIPLALIVLLSEHINRHRLSPDVSNGMRYAGVAMIYVASAADMFIAGVGNSMWLPVILAVLCVAGVLAGIMLRVRAFIYLGVGFLLLDIFSMIWHAAVDLQQTWVWYASGIVLGVVVLALFAYLEKRRTHAKEAPEGDAGG
jgi:hypothetical protein